jgi:hypothetical protein
MSFNFELGQEVNITLADVSGTVYGRAEYWKNKHVNSYWIRFLNGDGDAVYSWYDEDDLEEAIED